MLWTSFKFSSEPMRCDEMCLYKALLTPVIILVSPVRVMIIRTSANRSTSSDIIWKKPPTCHFMCSISATDNNNDYSWPVTYCWMNKCNWCFDQTLCHTILQIVKIWYAYCQNCRTFNGTTSPNPGSLVVTNEVLPHKCYCNDLVLWTRVL